MATEVDVARSDVRASLFEKMRAAVEREHSVSPREDVPHERRLEAINRSIRSWLGAEIGDLRKVWLILGAAPDPTIPLNLPEDHILVCVNNAGLTARKLGLKTPDLTIRTEAKSWREVAGLESRTLLWFTSRQLRKMRNARPASWQHRIGSLRTLRAVDRDDYLKSMLGDEYIKTDDFDARPSTGIFSCLMALQCNPEKVILSGFSVRQGGHSYNDLNAARKHIEADLSALKKISNNNQNILTAEAELSEDTGVPLF